MGSRQLDSRGSGCGSGSQRSNRSHNRNRKCLQCVRAYVCVRTCVCVHEMKMMWKLGNWECVARFSAVAHIKISDASGNTTKYLSVSRVFVCAGSALSASRSNCSLLRSLLFSLSSSLCSSSPSSSSLSFSLLFCLCRLCSLALSQPSLSP